MIDWFPPTSSDSPARSLARWHGIVSLRRAARAIDALEPTTEGHSERVADLAAASRGSSAGRAAAPRTCARRARPRHRQGVHPAVIL